MSSMKPTIDLKDVLKYITPHHSVTDPLVVHLGWRSASHKSKSVCVATLFVYLFGLEEWEGGGTYASTRTKRLVAETQTQIMKNKASCINSSATPNNALCAAIFESVHISTCWNSKNKQPWDPFFVLWTRPWFPMPIHRICKPGSFHGSF